MLRELNLGSQPAPMKEAPVLKQSILELPLAARIETGWTVYGVLISFFLGSPNPYTSLSFRFVGIFEYIILPMLIIFLDMCPNSYG